MSRRPAITALLKGHAVKVGLCSTRVTSNRGSARRSARAQMAPPNPPPMTMMRALACDRHGFGSSTIAATALLRRARRVALITAGLSMPLRHPGSDRLDLVVGEALRNSSHNRRRALARAERQHRRDDFLGILPAQRRHLYVRRSARRMAPRAGRRL